MREVAVRVPGGRYPLIHLNDMHGPPGNSRGSQRAQHHPGRMAAAHGHYKKSMGVSMASHA